MEEIDERARLDSGSKGKLAVFKSFAIVHNQENQPVCFFISILFTDYDVIDAVVRTLRLLQLARVRIINSLLLGDEKMKWFSFLLQLYRRDNCFPQQQYASLLCTGEEKLQCVALNWLIQTYSSYILYLCTMGHKSTPWMGVWETRTQTWA